MFLGVSATLGHVDITDSDRKRIGQTVEIRRRAKFGTKSAAYRQAGLNAATWDRIEQGEPVRDDRLAAALKLLWPSSEGDWRKAVSEMDAGMARIVKARYPMFGGSWEDPEYLANIESWMEEIQGRVGILEAAVFKESTDEQRNAAATTDAGATPAAGTGSLKQARKTQGSHTKPQADRATP